MNIYRDLSQGSLSPTISYSANPSVCEITSNVTLAVTVDEIKEYALIYDAESDNVINAQISSVQSMLERFVNRDATPRSRVAFWEHPHRYIRLPYGIHNNVVVYQRSRYEDNWELKTVDEDYYLSNDGSQFENIQLQRPVMTKVEYVSGYVTTPDIMKQGIIQEVAYFFKNRNDPEIESPETKHGMSKQTFNLLSGFVRY